jgi:hypothetical protein
MGRDKSIEGKLDAAPETKRASNDDALLSFEETKAGTQVTASVAQVATPDANATMTNATRPENEMPWPDQILSSVAATHVIQYTRRTPCNRATIVVAGMRLNRGILRQIEVFAENCDTITTLR